MINVSVSVDVENFWSKILKHDLWNAYEVKSYIFRNSSKERWKIVVLRIELVREKSFGVQELLEGDRIKMIEEVCNINSLKHFLTQISSKADLGSEFVSLELIESELKYGFKQRNNVKSDYQINYPCFVLTASGKRIDSLEKIEYDIESNQTGDTRSYLTIKDACKKLLQIDYDHTHPPSVAILAPIMIKIEKTKFTDKKIEIMMSCSSNFQTDDLQLEVYGLDKHDQQDSYFDNLNLQQKNIVENSIILTYKIEGNFSSDALKVIIKYKEDFVEDTIIKKSDVATHAY